MSLLAATGAVARELSGLARVLSGSGAEALADGKGTRLRLDLSLPVPWRAEVAKDPWRLVVEFSQIDGAGLDPSAFTLDAQITGMRLSQPRPGWSRVEFSLPRPMRLASAGMATNADVPARLELVLLPGEEDAAAEAAPFAPMRATDLPQTPKRQDGSRRLRVALDPGHGGRDPGAERAGYREADLVLTFALELAEALRRDDFDVILTRQDDHFVPLERRITLAREGEADILISLHADTVAEGEAQGITLYVQDDAAQEAAAQRLAEKHARHDLLSGVDLTGREDEVARVLMSLARADTAPRSMKLAEALLEGFRASVGGLYQQPLMHADFAVLKAPDLPSVLVELGYLSSEEDRAKLLDPLWRKRAEAGIVNALKAWAIADAAEARLIRN